MSLLKRMRVLAAKIETTSGTVESLAGTDAQFNAFGVEIQAQAEFLERPSQGSFGHLPGVVGARGGTLKFSTEISGDGSGGVPTWASTFLPACGWVNSTGTFSPKTAAPGSDVKTLTLAVFENGLKKTLRGAAGKFKLMLVAGKIAMIEWEFMGVWQAPVDAGILTPTYPTDIPLRFAASSLTVGGSAPGCIESLEIESGNNVILRECPTPSDGSGYEAALITDRKPIGKMNPESRLIATDDVFGEWLSGTENALSIPLADAADTITIAAPKMQRTNIQEGDRNGIQTDEIDFQCNKSAAAGDDELTITFAAT